MTKWLQPSSLSTPSSVGYQAAMPEDDLQSPSPLQSLPPFRGHSPDQERPLGGYAALMGTFAVASTGFGVWLRMAGRELPERVEPGDLALITVAGFRVARLTAKDRVTSTLRAPFTRFQDDAGPSEVSEQARGHGLRRALGELLICPYCLELWVVAVLAAGLIAAPRPTRWASAVFTALTGADLLQIGYKRAQDLLSD